jgi:UDP-glucose 4-epimerase
VLEVAGINEPGAVASAFAEFEPDRAFHLAAQVDVRHAMTNPALDAEVNVLGTIQVLEAARERSTPVILASTGGAIYGEGEGRDLPFDESADCRPETPYGQSKLAAEGYLELYGLVHGVPGIALRLGNVYGPRQDPHGEAGVVAIFCGRMLTGAAPTIFGDGEQTRDYVYVGDVASAFVSAGDRLVADGLAVGGPLNVGTGTETSVLALAEALRTQAERPDLMPELAPARPGEVQRSALDASAAGEALGWGASTAIGAGLVETLASVRRQAG